MHPAKAEEPWTGDRLEIPEFHEIAEICKTGIRQLLRSPYDSGRKSCWNARDLKQALNIHVLGSTTGTNLRSHSITTFNHYDRRTRKPRLLGTESHFSHYIPSVRTNMQLSLCRTQSSASLRIGLAIAVAAIAMIAMTAN